MLCLVSQTKKVRLRVVAGKPIARLEATYFAGLSPWRQEEVSSVPLFALTFGLVKAKCRALMEEIGTRDLPPPLLPSPSPLPSCHSVHSLWQPSTQVFLFPSELKVYTEDAFSVQELVCSSPWKTPLHPSVRHRRARSSIRLSSPLQLELPTSI